MKFARPSRKLTEAYRGREGILVHFKVAKVGFDDVFANVLGLMDVKDAR